MKAKILVVDDEADALELIRFNLESAGFRVGTAATGSAALQKVPEFGPELIILDWMLPDMDGLEVCKRLRHNAASASIPIVMLTAKASEMDRVLGLEMGADDYLTKPFSSRELVLRVQKRLKTNSEEKEAPTVYTFGKVVINLPEHYVRVAGKRITLTTTEFKLLATLAERRGRVQSREQLLKDVWEYESDIDSRTVDTHMRRLRQKLGSSADYLETVRGFGYRLTLG